MTVNYKTITEFLGEPYRYVGGQVFMRPGNPYPQSNWDLIGAVLEKLAREGRGPHLMLLESRAAIVDLFRPKALGYNRSSAIEAISALCEALKEGK